MFASGTGATEKQLLAAQLPYRAGLAAWDLEELELAHAPPFGSAKDPVNMAGFVACNVLLGDLKLWYAQDYPKATDGARIMSAHQTTTG